MEDEADVPVGELEVYEDEPDEEQYMEFETVYVSEYMLDMDNVQSQNRVIERAVQLRNFLYEVDQHATSTEHKKLLGEINQYMQNISQLQKTIRETVGTTRSRVSHRNELQHTLEKQFEKEHDLLNEYKELVQKENDNELPDGGGEVPEDEPVYPVIENRPAARQQGARSQPSEEAITLSDKVISYWFQKPKDYVAHYKSLKPDELDTRVGDLKQWIVDTQLLQEEDDRLDILLEELNDVQEFVEDAPEKVELKYVEIRDYLKTHHVSTRELQQLRDWATGDKPRGYLSDEEFAHVMENKAPRFRGEQNKDWKEWKSAVSRISSLNLREHSDLIWMHTALQEMSGLDTTAKIHGLFNYYTHRMMKEEHNVWLTDFMPEPLEKWINTVLDHNERETARTEWSTWADKVNKFNFQSEQEIPTRTPSPEPVRGIPVEDYEERLVDIIIPQTQDAGGVLIADPEDLENLPEANPAHDIDDEKVDEREQIAWQAWLRQPLPRDDPLKRIIDAGLHEQYYYFNRYTGMVQEKRTHTIIPGNVRRLHVSRRSKLSDRGRVRFQDRVKFRYHPETHRQEMARKKSVKNDDWSKIHQRAQQAQIGEYISLSILPAVLFINIRKAVQITALQIIVKRIVEHATGVPTRILLKKSIRTGKYTYKPWISSKELDRMGESGLFSRFISATNNRRRGISIIVRQNIARGKLQRLFERTHSLL